MIKAAYSVELLLRSPCFYNSEEMAEIIDDTGPDLHDIDSDPDFDTSHLDKPPESDEDFDRRAHRYGRRKPPPRAQQPQYERNFRAPSKADRLQPGEGLRLSQELNSPNGQVKLCFQGDANFVLYVNGGVRWVYKLWRSEYPSESTFSHRGRSTSTSVMMQEDGNLVIEGSKRDVVWATNTHEDTHGDSASFIVKDDGTAVIETGSGRTVWSTVSL